MKTITTILACICILKCAGQNSLVLKPGLSIGYGFNSWKDKGTAESSFKPQRPGFNLTLNGRVEYYLKNKSSVDLTIKGSEAAFSFGLELPGFFKHIYQTGIETMQLNLGYNYALHTKSIFKKLSNNTLFLRPKLGLGLGISKNKNANYYREYSYNQYFGVTTSTYTYWQLYTAIPEKNIGYNLLVRFGFSIIKQKRELFDLVLEYNKGLSNLSNMDLQYNINGTTYHTVLVSRGSNLNLTVGVPLTLIRFKK